MCWEELGQALSLQTRQELQQFVQEPQQGCEGLLPVTPNQLKTNSTSPPQTRAAPAKLAVPSASKQMAREGTLSFLPGRTDRKSVV